MGRTLDDMIREDVDRVFMNTEDFALDGRLLVASSGRTLDIRGLVSEDDDSEFVRVGKIALPEWTRPAKGDKLTFNRGTRKGDEDHWYVRHVEPAEAGLWTMYVEEWFETLAAILTESYTRDEDTGGQNGSLPTPAAEDFTHRVKVVKFEGELASRSGPRNQMSNIVRVYFHDMPDISIESVIQIQTAGTQYEAEAVTQPETLNSIPFVTARLSERP